MFLERTFYQVAIFEIAANLSKSIMGLVMDVL